MPVCPSCGSQQPEGAAFCSACGAVQPASKLGSQYPPTVLSTRSSTIAIPACSQCGERLSSDDKFCDMCGTRVKTPAQSAITEPGGPAPSIPAGKVPGVAATLQGQDPLLTPIPPSAQSRPPAALGWLAIHGSDAQLPLPSGKTELIIGRQDSARGVFPDIDLAVHRGEECGISRQHARVVVQGTLVFIEDLNSTNGTFVNRQRLTPGNLHPLTSGDEIQLGWIKLVFRR